MNKQASRCIGNDSCSVRWINGKVGPLCPFHDQVEDALQTVARWRKLSHARTWPVVPLLPQISTFVGPDGIGSSISQAAAYLETILRDAPSGTPPEMPAHLRLDRMPGEDG